MLTTFICFLVAVNFDKDKIGNYKFKKAKGKATVGEKFLNALVVNCSGHFSVSSLQFDEIFVVERHTCTDTPRRY